MGMIANMRDNVRTHQIVQELISLFFVFRASAGIAETSKNASAPLFRDKVETLTPFFASFARLAACHTSPAQPIAAANIAVRRSLMYCERWK